MSSISSSLNLTWLAATRSAAAGSRQISFEESKISTKDHVQKIKLSSKSYPDHILTEFLLCTTYLFEDVSFLSVKDLSTVSPVESPTFLKQFSRLIWKHLNARLHNKLVLQQKHSYR